MKKANNKIKQQYLWGVKANDSITINRKTGQADIYLLKTKALAETKKLRKKNPKVKFSVSKVYAYNKLIIMPWQLEFSAKNTQ